jgi:hypothetical protein
MSMVTNPMYRTWILVMGLAGMVVAVLLIVAGIGLLQCRPWGRKISIGYAIYTIVVSLLGSVISGVMMSQSFSEMAGGDAGGMGIAAIGGLGGAIGGACVSLIYPIVLLVFMFRPSVVEACSGVAYSPAEPPPLDGEYRG